MNRREFLSATIAAGCVYLPCGKQGTIPDVGAQSRPLAVSPVFEYSDEHLWQILDDPNPCDTLEALQDWLKARYDCICASHAYDDGFMLEPFGAAQFKSDVQKYEFIHRFYRHKNISYGAVDEEFLPLLTNTVKADFSNAHGAGERIFFRYPELVRLQNGVGEHEGKIVLRCRYSALNL